MTRLGRLSSSLPPPPKPLSLLSCAMPEAAERRALNKRLSQIFRMRGLALRPDAMQPLYDLLHNDEDGWETASSDEEAPTEAPP